MPIEGTINSLYLDYEQTKPLFPRTKTKAVSADSGVSLDVLLDEMNYNISNKAPAGFGLGENFNITKFPLLDDTVNLNNVVKNGWYHWAASAPVNAPMSYCIMRVWSGYGGYALQEVMTGHLNHENVIMRRFTNGGESAWGEWEYVNPPMMAGVEYRTTERYGGHPVYAQRVIVKSIPTGTLITLVPESTSLVRFECKIQQDDGLHEIWSPFFYGSIDSAYSAFTYVYKERTGAIRCNFNCGANIDVDAAAYVTVWYTKD